MKIVKIIVALLIVGTGSYGDSIFGTTKKEISIAKSAKLIDTGSINGTIDSVLSGMSDIEGMMDNIFKEFDLDSILNDIVGDNQILGCLAQDVDVNSIIKGGVGSIDLPALPDGLCSISSLKEEFGKNIFGEKLTGCLKGNINIETGKLDHIFEGLEGLCNGTSEVGDTSTGGGNPNGEPTGWGHSNGNFGSSMEYGTGIIRVTSVESSGLGDKDDKPIGEKKYPNNKTVHDIYGKDGGVIMKQALADPSSSTSNAWRHFDVPTLTLKEIVAKKIVGDSGDFNEKIYKLPATMEDVLKVEGEMATFQGIARPNLFELQNYIIRSVRGKYTSIQTDTLSAYYQEEKKAFDEFVRGNEAIALVKQLALKGIEDRYNVILFNKRKEKGYIPDISEARASYIDDARQNKFKFDAIIQMNEEALIKSKMVLEKDKMSEKINKEVALAYPMSSIFRGDIAKREIDALLRAVDQAIK